MRSQVSLRRKKEEEVWLQVHIVDYYFNSEIKENNLFIAFYQSHIFLKKWEKGRVREWHLELPSELNCQAALFYIPAIYMKTFYVRTMHTILLDIK